MCPKTEVSIWVFKVEMSDDDDDMGLTSLSLSNRSYGEELQVFGIVNTAALFNQSVWLLDKERVDVTVLIINITKNSLNTTHIR